MSFYRQPHAIDLRDIDESPAGIGDLQELDVDTANLIDMVAEYTTGVVIDGRAAENVISLGEGTPRKVEQIGEFGDADAFWFAADSLGQEVPTMYMG